MAFKNSAQHELLTETKKKTPVRVQLSCSDDHFDVSVTAPWNEDTANNGTGRWNTYGPAKSFDDSKKRAEETIDTLLGLIDKLGIA